jgi:hypothetical protein
MASGNQEHNVVGHCVAMGISEGPPLLLVARPAAG